MTTLPAHRLGPEHHGLTVTVERGGAVTTGRLMNVEVLGGSHYPPLWLELRIRNERTRTRVIPADHPVTIEEAK